MSQTGQDNYQRFTVGLLTDSFALEALWKDALKHHMTEHLGQLIALRLTEYYELMTQRVVPVPYLVKPGVPVEAEDRGSKESLSPAKEKASPMPTALPHSPSPTLTQESNHHVLLTQRTGSMRAVTDDKEDIIFASPAADQNADEAADYWSTL